MELATQTHLKPLRDAIVFRLAELRAELQAADQARSTEAATRLPEVGDRKDDAARAQNAAVSDASAQRDVDEAAQYEAALHRLDTGRYGDCQDCGEPIALQRLQVQPAALRCAPCQQQWERGPVHTAT